MKKKAVFFDIDDTLWDFQNQIPESTVKAIKELQKNGHLTFLCSGRARAFINDPDLLSLGFDGIVSSCGAMIEHQGQVVFCKELDTDLVEKTLLTVRRCGMRPILEGKDYLYMDDEEFQDDPYGHKLRKEMTGRLLTIAGEWGRWQISKLSCATENADCETVYKELGEFYDFIMHDAPVVEIVPRGFDKGSGLRQTCELLGIDIADTYAFGDSANDLAMLKAAGTGIAMGNGTDRAKEAADYVTTDMKEDGIWNACRHFGLI